MLTRKKITLINRTATFDESVITPPHDAQSPNVCGRTDVVQDRNPQTTAKMQTPYKILTLLNNLQLQML